ncbi:MAG: flagellar export protein FliJ [Bdellovibrionaceae bacterium]|nr:flagellar export protein FliJ [Pseudobdellovibrionaceae bacterium]NUM59399.1 flagellar export protein FliJ [Pseudobdellovibrionaceae bacterium]
MKFKFRMQKVLEHRKTLENIAKADLESSQAKLNKEIEILQDMIDLKKRSRLLTYEAQVDTVQSTASEKKFIFSQADSFQGLQDIRIEKQKEIIKILEKEVESKREILKNRAIEYKIIDKFKEKKMEQFKDELKKKEQSEIDEIVVLRQALGRSK